MNQPISLTNLILVAYAAAAAIGCRHNDGLDPSEPVVIPWADAGKTSPPSLPPMPGDESPTASLGGVAGPAVRSRGAAPPVPWDGVAGAGGRVIGPPGAAGSGGTAIGGPGGTGGRLP